MSCLEVDVSERVVALLLAVMAVLFGGFCVYMGHNSTIISSVFGLIGIIIGYVYGKKTQEEPKEEPEEGS